MLAFGHWAFSPFCASSGDEREREHVERRTPSRPPSPPATLTRPPRLPRRERRRRLGGSVSIVGTDVNEEVVSRAVPKTPATAPRPASRRSLRERNANTDAAPESDDAVGKERGDTREVTRGADANDGASRSDDAEGALVAGLRLMRRALRTMRDGGVDPKKALADMCRRGNSREAASTVVARLVAALEDHEGDEAAAEDEDKAEAEAEAEPDEAVEADVREVEPHRESRGGTSEDGAEAEEEDEAFATAPPSPAEDALSAAVASMSIRAEAVEEVAVEEGVMGCGLEACGGGANGAGCDGRACLSLARRGGPFVLPAALVSKAAEVAPAETEEGGTDGEGYDSEVEESVAETEEGTDEEEEEEASESESVAGTESVNDDDDADGVDENGSPLMSPGPEVVDVAELTDEREAPSPEVCAVVRTTRGDGPVSTTQTGEEEEVTSAEKPASADPARSGSSDSEAEAPFSARKRRGGRRARLVLSDEEEGASSSPGTPPPVCVVDTPPGALRPAAAAPPTTGKKKSMLRVKSAKKLDRRPDFDSATDAEASRSSAAGDEQSGGGSPAASRPKSVLKPSTYAPPAAAEPAGAPMPAYPKSALKTSGKFATAAAANAASSPVSPPPARRASTRPRRRAAVKASVEFARMKALSWLDDAAACGDDGSEEEESSGAASDDEGGSDSDDDFVVNDDEVEYDSDASSDAIAEDVAARAAGAPKSILKGTGGKPRLGSRGGGGGGGRGLTFRSPQDAEASDSDAGSTGSSPEPIALASGAQDPYGLDELRTPTPPPAGKPFSSTPGGANGLAPKTPKSTIGRKTAGGFGGYGEPPPTHSKALAAALASAAKPGKTLNYARHKETIARALYDEFNRDAFDGKLPPKLEISWNAKLLTTAGLTHYKKITRSSGVSEYHARIELSTKVLDTAEKLEATLLHEMCHAAAWLLDHCAKPPHGAVFKRWANKAMKTYPGVSVDTCHSYQIHQPYKYRCTQSWCGQEYGRHSKSIDVEAKACGVCNGKLEFIGKFNADGTRVEERAATAFSLFVKEHFGAVKERLPAGTPHKTLMKELSIQWKSGGGGTGKKTRGGVRGDDEDDDDDDVIGGMKALKL